MDDISNKSDVIAIRRKKEQVFKSQKRRIAINFFTKRNIFNSIAKKELMKKTPIPEDVIHLVLQYSGPKLCDDVEYRLFS